MAKPIKSTPELSHEEANKFLEKMIKVEKSRITEKQKNLAKQIEKNMAQLLVC